MWVLLHAEHEKLGAWPLVLNEESVEQDNKTAFGF